MPSEHPFLVALRGDEAYARYLDRLLKAARKRGVRVETRHQLAELALAEMGCRYDLMAPRRLPKPGRPRKDVEG